MRTTIIVLVVMMSVVPGCENEDRSADLSQVARLHLVGDCGAVVWELKHQAIREMEEQVDRNRAAILAGEYCWDDDWYGYADGSAGYADASSDGGSTPPVEEGDAAGDHSDTNNQVLGVDEADFIKNDGAYIYILAAGKLQIIDAWPALETHVVSRTAIEGEPARLFVFADRAVVYSALGEVDYGYGGRSDCTYGYDCDFTGDGRETKITVFDLADRANPVLLRETRFSGSFLASRSIESAVFTVLHFPGVRFPSLSYWPAGYPACGEELSRYELDRAFEALKRQNRRIISETPEGDWLPSASDTIYGPDGPRTSTEFLSACSDLWSSELGDGTSFLAVHSFDPTRSDPADVTMALGRPGAVYVSRDALYVSARHALGVDPWDYRATSGAEEFSTVYKFTLDPAAPGAAYAAAGVVPGHVLNQFAMDEYDGFLRIAASEGWVPDPSVHSTLSVLQQTGDTLDVVGTIDDIAPGEDIRSVRFDGDRGFIVTFKKTDPLFALDLADPRHPRIRGELLIPGFSTYMHPMDQTHLLTIGYDADDLGDFAWFQGIQLQIFDVSDLDNPTLLHRELIGTRGSTSDAATDHLAFNFYAPRDVLALPMVICEGGDGGMYGDAMTFSGLLVYRVTIAGGFESLGRVSHADTASFTSVSCNNWWNESNSQVQRSLFMEDYVYSVAPDAIKVNRLDSLGADLAVVNLLE